MYYKNVCKALLLMLVFSPVMAEQPAQAETLKTAYIKPLSPNNGARPEVDTVYSKTRKVLEQLMFYRGLIKGNSTLKSYQLQQEKLAALEEDLANLYLQKVQIDPALAAFNRALEHYRNLAGVQSKNKLKWLWQQISVHSRIVIILKSLGRSREALTQARQITALHQQLVLENPASQLLRTELANHYFFTAKLLVLNDELQPAKALLQQATEQYKALDALQSGAAQQSPDAPGQTFRLLEIKTVLAGIEAVSNPVAGINAYHQLKDEVQAYLLLFPGEPGRLGYLAENIYIPLAEIQVWQGDIRAALAARQQAHEIFAQLLRVTPEANAIKRNMAANQLQLAEHHKLLGEPRQAIEVFKAAQVQYADLMQSEAQDSRWKHYQSVTVGAIGELYFQLGEYELAFEYQEQAIVLAQTLTKEDPHSVKWAQLLLVAHWRNAQVYFAQEQFVKALGAYQLALRPAELVLSLDPDNAENRSVVAEAHENLATTLKQIDPEGITPEHFAAALKHDEQALAHYLHLAAQADNKRHWLSVLDQYVDIARLQQSREHYSEAIRLCEKALKVFEDNAVREASIKDDSQWLSRIALSYALMAQNQIALKEEAAALQAFGLAHEHYRRLIRLEPAENLWQDLLGKSLMLEADLLQSRKTFPVAIKRYEEVLNLYQTLSRQQPDNQDYAQNKLLVYIKLGDVYDAYPDRPAALNMFYQAELYNRAERPADNEPDQQWYAYQHHIMARQARNFTLTGNMTQARYKYRELYQLVKEAAASAEDPLRWRGTDILGMLNLGDAYENHANTEQAHRLFLEAMNSVRENMPEQGADDYDYMRYILLQVHFYNGLLAQKLGKAREAEHHFNNAGQLITEYLAGDPESREWQVEQVILAIYRGDLRLLNNQPEKAAQAFQQAEEQVQSFLEDEPDHSDHSDYLFYLALIYERQGQAHYKKGDFKQAKAMYRLEQALYFRLLKKDVDQVFFKQGLSENYRRMAMVYQEEKDYSRAVSVLKKAQTLTQNLLLRSPGFNDWQLNLAKNYLWLGRFQAERKNNKKAQQYFQLAIDEMLKLTELNPGIVEWQTELAAGYYDLAQLPLTPAQQKAMLMGKASGIIQGLEEQGRLYPVHRHLLEKPGDPKPE